MNITLYCPNLRCRMVLEVPEKTRGRRVRCSRCGTNFMVPIKAGVPKPSAGKGTVELVDDPTEPSAKS